MIGLQKQQKIKHERLEKGSWRGRAKLTGNQVLMIRLVKTKRKKSENHPNDVSYQIIAF